MGFQVSCGPAWVPFMSHTASTAMANLDGLISRMDVRQSKWWLQTTNDWETIAAESKTRRCWFSRHKFCCWTRRKTALHLPSENTWKMLQTMSDLISNWWSLIPVCHLILFGAFVSLFFEICWDSAKFAVDSSAVKKFPIYIFQSPIFVNFSNTFGVKSPIMANCQL